MTRIAGWLLHVVAMVILAVTSCAQFLPDETECPETRHPGIISNEYWVPFGVPFRAWRTLPWRYFIIKQSSISGAGMGVIATTFIPGNTWLGEYEGDIIVGEFDSLLVYAWNGYADDEVTHYIDGVDPTRSNWLRFINCPNRDVDVNIQSHFCYGRVYYRLTKDIYPGQELFVYYGAYYAEELGILDTYFTKT